MSHWRKTPKTSRSFVKAVVFHSQGCTGYVFLSRWTGLPQVRKFSMIRQDTAYRIKPLVTKLPTSWPWVLRTGQGNALTRETGDSEAIQCEKLNECSSLGISLDVTDAHLANSARNDSPSGLRIRVTLLAQFWTTLVFQ